MIVSGACATLVYVQVAESLSSSVAVAILVVPVVVVGLRVEEPLWTSKAHTRVLKLHGGFVGLLSVTVMLTEKPGAVGMPENCVTAAPPLVVRVNEVGKPVESVLPVV